MVKIDPESNGDHTESNVDHGTVEYGESNGEHGTVEYVRKISVLSSPG